MASMLHFLWCVCLFVAGGPAWASNTTGTGEIEDEMAEMMAQSIVRSLTGLEDGGSTALPNLMIYILGQHLDGYFPLGMHKDQLIKNIFYQHLDTAKGFTVVNCDYRSNDDDQFVDIASSPMFGGPDIKFVSRLIYYFGGIIARDQLGLVKKNLIRISWINEGHQCFTFRFLNPKHRDEYVSIIGHDMGQNWLTGFVQEKNFPDCVFESSELVLDSLFDNAIWDFYYKGEPICESFVGLTQATEFVLFLNEHHVIPDLALFQDGHVKEDLNRISFTINNHLKDDQTFFISQFVRYNLAFITHRLSSGKNPMSQFLGMDFVGSTKTKIVTNFYFPADIDPENIIFEIRQLFFKIGLKFKYDMPEHLFAFRPAMFSVGQKSKAITKPVQYGTFVSEYLNNLSRVHQNARNNPIILDFQYIDPAKTAHYGLLVAKVTFKMTSTDPRMEFFAQIYETLGNLNMEQMQNLDLKEFRIVPLKNDEFTLYVSIIRAAEDASLQIALVQEVLTLILRSVGISNEVFIGTMSDMTKKFNLIKGVTALSKEIKGNSAIEFKVETKADRDVVRRKAEKIKLEEAKKEAEREKKRTAAHQPAQKTYKQLLKEASKKERETPSPKKIVEPVPEVKEEEEVVVIQKPAPEIPVKKKKTKVKPSKRRLQEMLQSGQLKRNKQPTNVTDQQEEPSLEAQIEAVVAQMSPLEPTKTKTETTSTTTLPSEEKIPTPKERALEQKEPKKPSPEVQPTVSGSESILQWFQFKDEKHTTAALSGPVLGPAIGLVEVASGPIYGPVIAQAKIPEEVKEVPEVETFVAPVVEPTPEKEEPKASTSTTTSTTTTTSTSTISSAPVKKPGLSADAATFVPSTAAAGKGTAISTATSDFYASPRVVMTSAGEPLSQGHHVGSWTSYSNFNLWSNHAWTRFQSVHIISRKLGPKLPTERYFSLVFGLKDAAAGICLNQVVNWVVMNADYYVRMRTVAVSLVGSAHSVIEGSTSIVFTLRFPDDDDFSSYTRIMAGYATEVKAISKLFCPLIETAIKETAKPANRKESWELVQMFPNGALLIHSNFSSLYTAGSWLKHMESDIFANVFYLARTEPLCNDMDPQYQIRISSVNIQALYDVLLSMLETMVEDSWTESYRKYPFLPYANYIQIEVSKTKGLGSDLIIQLDPDTPQEILIESQKLAKYISSGVGYFTVLGLQSESKLLPFYTQRSIEQQATRQIYNTNMHAYNTREIPTNVSMIVRFLESQEAPRDLEKWFTIQHLVEPDNLETLERLLNELFALPRHAGLVNPRAFWHRKISEKRYVVGVAFLAQPIEQHLCAIVDALCVYSGLHQNDYSEAFTELSVPLLQGWQVDGIVDKAMAAYILPEEKEPEVEQIAAEELHETPLEDNTGQDKSFEEASLPVIQEELPEIVVEEVPVRVSPPVRRTMPKEYVPVIPSTTFFAIPNFFHSQTHWRFVYQVDNSTPIDKLKLRIPHSCNGQFYGYLNALTEQLPRDYWKKGYGLMVDRLYTDLKIFEEIEGENDVVFHLAVTGRSRPGDVLLVLVKMLSAIVTHGIPVDRIIIVSMKDVGDAKIKIIALPTITMGQLARLKKESGESIKWVQKY